MILAWASPFNAVNTFYIINDTYTQDIVLLISTYILL